MPRSAAQPLQARVAGRHGSQVGTQLQPWRTDIAVGSHCFGCTAAQTDRKEHNILAHLPAAALANRQDRKEKTTKENSVPTFSMRSSTSMPSITCPKMVYLPAAQQAKCTNSGSYSTGARRQHQSRVQQQRRRRPISAAGYQRLQQGTHQACLTGTPACPSLTIEVGVRLVCDEELRAVGVGSAVGHGHNAALHEGPTQ